jgi:drug/metabolite transporter (DMT)-like permease
LSLANGILVALVLFLIYPKQDWTQLWQEKRTLGMMMLYLIFGSGAYLFNAYAIRDKDATFASLLEITYPIFIIVFTAVFLGKFHLSFVGSIGAALILAGGAIVMLSRGR